MGNKHTKKIYEILVPIFHKQKTLAKDLPFPYLSECEIAEYLERVMKVALKEEHWKALEKGMNFNVTTEEDRKELEGKNKKMSESSLYSLLVAGHEAQPEIVASFQGVQLEDALAPNLDSVKKYSRQKVIELAVGLLELVEKAESDEEIKSFYQRVSQHLSKSTGNLAESSGISMALCLSALLIEPGKLLKDDYTSLSMLKMFTEIPSLIFHGWDKQNLVIERAIDYVKQSLLDQLELNVDVPERIKEDTIKILCHIGLSRGSIEDLLIGIRLMKEDIDLTEIVKKILELDELESRIIKLEASEQNHRFPFEEIYISKKNDWLTEKDTNISSATDSEYIYFYNPKHGLMLMGAGDATIKGKLYKTKEFIEDNKSVQLIHLNKKIYCLIKNVLFNLDINTMKLKKTKKNLLLNDLQNYKITGNDNRLVIYLEEKKTRSENIEAKVIIHYVHTKQATELSIVHKVNDVKELVLYDNLLILIGNKRYEVIDLIKKKTAYSDESKILKQATFCCSSEKLFGIYFTEREGFMLEEFSLPSVREKTIPLLDSSIENVKKLLNINQTFNPMPKQTVESLLGIVKEKIGSKELTKPSIAKGTENLLALLAHRAIDAEQYIKSINPKNSKEILKAYKCPIAIHLTTQCLDTLFKLLQEQYNKLTSESPIELKKLWYIIIILNAHFIALGVCDISLEDLLGAEMAKSCDEKCKKILSSLINDNKIDGELMKLVKEYANCCFKNSSSLYKLEADDIFKQFHQWYKEEKTDIDQVINWLKTSSNCKVLANKILNQDKNALNFLNEYFAIEVRYFSKEVQGFIKGDKVEKVVYKKLFELMFVVVEKVFLNNELYKKSKEVQEIVVSILPEMIYPHLKQVVADIKRTYTQYKSSLQNNLKELKEKERLGPMYAEYWKFIEKLLRSKMIMFNVFSYLTTAVMGLSLSADKLVTFAKLLVKSTRPLKELLSVLVEEKSDKGFFLRKLEETFENTQIPIENTINTSKEYNFLESTSIQVYTTESIEIPPPEENGIKVSTKKGEVVVINRVKPDCKISVKSTNITLSASIRYVHSKKNLPYKGYNIKIMPKVN